MSHLPFVDLSAAAVLGSGLQDSQKWLGFHLVVGLRFRGSISYNLFTLDED